uniref:Uncharacterized protein n=1 Tax=Oryza barthii TaxID=65489 RepID=A0A0D3G620_9ORYZ
MRAAREVTERALEERAAALRREAREWERRADEQRRLVAELMRLIGMPEVYTPVEPLRSKEERKRKEGIAHSGSLDTASSLLDDVRESCCDRESEGATTETSS